MAFERLHSATADATFSATGSANWNANQTPSGADVGGIPYCPTATTEATSANLTYTETSEPRLQVGNGGTTSAGVIIGYSGTSGFGGIWSTNVTPSISNYALLATSGTTYLNGPSALDLSVNNGLKMRISGTAGLGPAIFAGTATTDVQALSATQTWNASGVAFKGWKFTITDTASAAGSLAMQILGGAAGTTSLFSVSKGGIGLFGAIGTAYIADASGISRMTFGPFNGDMYWGNSTNKEFYFQSTVNVQVQSDMAYAWSNSTSDATQAAHSGLNSPAAGVVRVTNGTTGGGALELLEQTAPAGASNTARLFTQDNGGGKTQLMVIFGSGAAQQIAIEA